MDKEQKARMVQLLANRTQIKHEILMLKCREADAVRDIKNVLIDAKWFDCMRVDFRMVKNFMESE